MSVAYCFDLDGTITKDEILPILSKEVGLFEEIGALTDATVKGIIPFRKSFLLRCRLLREIPIARVQEIVNQVRFNEKILDFIKTNKENSYIVTGNLDAWVQPLIDQMGCKYFSSQAEISDGHLGDITYVINKDEALNKIRKKHDRLIAIGDGMGDVAMFEAADTSIAFGGAHRPVDTLIKLSDYVTFDEATLCRILNTLS